MPKVITTIYIEHSELIKAKRILKNKYDISLSKYLREKIRELIDKEITERGLNKDVVI